MKFESKYIHFHSRKFIWWYHLQTGGHFISAPLHCSKSTEKSRDFPVLITRTARLLRINPIHSQDTQSYFVSDWHACPTYWHLLYYNNINFLYAQYRIEHNQEKSICTGWHLCHISVLVTQEQQYQKAICLLRRRSCHMAYSSMHSLFFSHCTRSGAWFNIKMSSYQNRKSHCGDKTMLRPSYLHNGISYTGKTSSLYWIRAQIP